MQSLKLSIFLLLFLCLFNMANLSCETTDDDQEKGTNIPSSASDCFNREFDEFEKMLDAVKCCYVEYEDSDGSKKGCEPVTKGIYDDIDDYIDEVEDTLDLDIDEFDCKSNYLQSALLILLIIFL